MYSYYVALYLSWYTRNAYMYNQTKNQSEQT